MGEHLTSKVPELAEPNGRPLNVNDLAIVFGLDTYKTYRYPLGLLAQFFALGGGDSIPPNAADKGRYVFDITQAQINAGGDGKTIHIPEFAGKNFTLIIDGRPFLDSEYDVLNGGGFHINIEDYLLAPGMRAQLDFAEKLTDSGGGNNAGSGSLFSDKLIVNANITLTSQDINKIAQFRAGNNSITLTLADISAYPMFKPVIIESAISNKKQNAVATQPGQKIYMNNDSWDKLWVGPGEALWMYRDTDGFYVFNDFGQIYKEVGRKPQAALSIGVDEIICNNQFVNKADEPRLWQIVQTLAADGALIPYSQYDENMHRGCYVNFDDNTFRMPNLMDMTLKGLYSTSGDDPNRTYNKPGGYQHDHVGEINDSDITVSVSIQDGTGGSSTNGLRSGNNGNTGFAGMDNKGGKFTDTTGEWIDVNLSINSGKENLIKNVGVYWVVKK